MESLFSLLFPFLTGPGCLVTETPRRLKRYFAKYIPFGFFRLAECQNKHMASPKFTYYGKPTHGREREGLLLDSLEQRRHDVAMSQSHCNITHSQLTRLKAMSQSNCTITHSHLTRLLAMSQSNCFINQAVGAIYVDQPIKLQ